MLIITDSIVSGYPTLNESKTLSSPENKNRKSQDPKRPSPFN